MLKKLVIGSAAAVALGTFVFGRDVVSYISTGFHSVRAAVKSEVPIEFENGSEIPIELSLTTALIFLFSSTNLSGFTRIISSPILIWDINLVSCPNTA